jgi:hypothetical protein
MFAMVLMKLGMLFKCSFITITGSLTNGNGSRHSRGYTRRRPSYCLSRSGNCKDRPDAQLRITTRLSVGNHYCQGFPCIISSAHCTQKVLREILVGGYRIPNHLYRCLLCDHHASVQEFGHPVGQHSRNYVLGTNNAKSLKLPQHRLVQISAPIAVSTSITSADL